MEGRKRRGRERRGDKRKGGERNRSKKEGGGEGTKEQSNEEFLMIKETL